MKNLPYFIPSFLSLLLGGLAYLASDNYFIAGGVFLAVLLESHLFLLPMVKRFRERERKRHECYQFVHTFLVTLSVSSSLDRAYESCKENFSLPLKHIDEGLGNMGVKEKTEYLHSYFSMPIYGVFLSLLSLFQDRGGDVLKISGPLLEELTRIEDTGVLSLKDCRKNLVQFLSMWLMSLAIMSFVRFGLSSFFGTLSTSITYLICISAYFLFLLVSAFVYCRFYTGEPAWRKKA